MKEDHLVIIILRAVVLGLGAAVLILMLIDADNPRMTNPSKCYESTFAFFIVVAFIMLILWGAAGIGEFHLTLEMVLLFAGMMLAIGAGIEVLRDCHDKEPVFVVTDDMDIELVPSQQKVYSGDFRKVNCIIRGILMLASGLIIFVDLILRGIDDIFPNFPSC